MGVTKSNKKHFKKIIFKEENLYEKGKTGTYIRAVRKERKV